MRIASRLAAVSIALSVASLAQDSSNPHRSALARHFDALTRTEERNADGSYAITDAQLALVAKEIEQAIEVPPTWRVVLRHDDRPQFGQDTVHTRFQLPNELLFTTLSDRANRRLELVLSLDAQWVAIGRGAPFIGAYGTTMFNRRQFQVRRDFFPLSAIPVVLERLASELEALPLVQWNVRDLGLQSAQPMGGPPSIRCVLRLEDESPGRSATIELNGLIALPPTAAHEEGFEFDELSGDRDAVAGPVLSTLTLGQCYREAQAMRDAIQSVGEWYAHVFHGSGSRSFSTHVVDARKRHFDRFHADLRIDSDGFLGSTEEISAAIGGVSLTADGVRQFLKTLAGAYDTRKQYVFLVLGCADRREIIIVFTSNVTRRPAASDLTCLRLVFDPEGTKVDRMDRLPVHEIQREIANRRTRWTCRFGDDRVADVSVHTLVGCTTGDDVTSRARIGDTVVRVAGGLVETTLRRD